MKSACLSWFAALAVIAGCGSDDAPVCMGPSGISVIDSLDVGALSNTEFPDDLVAWNNGDEVEMEYGSQGFLMLVVTSVVRGTDLHRDSPYVEMTLASEDGRILSQSGVFGGATATEPRGAWYATEIYLAFEESAPADGAVVKLRVNTECLDLQRSLVIRRPSP